MTVYSDLLRLALDAEEPADDSIEQLLTAATTSRLQLSRMGRSTARLGDEIAYDLALVKLCRRMGLDTGLTASDAGGLAREATELALGERLPAFHEWLTR